MPQIQMSAGPRTLQRLWGRIHSGLFQLLRLLAALTVAAALWYPLPWSRRLPLRLYTHLSLTRTLVMSFRAYLSNPGCPSSQDP